MPYTIPATAVVGQPADLASWWNTYVRDNFETVAKPPASRVYRSVSQTIATSAVTLISYLSERYDMTGSAALHSTTSNPERFTIVTAGTYHFGACIEWASNATGARQVALLVNGSRVATDFRPPVGNAVTRQHVSCDWDLNAGDRVEVEVFQSSGSNLDVSASTGSQNEFWIHQFSQ